MGVRDVFLRKASGLVREISVFDVFISNTLYNSIGIVVPSTIYTVYLISAMLGVSSDFVLGTLLWLIPWCCVVLCFVFFSIAMPRSGGDYVYLSRVLHPSLGFMVNFTFMFWCITFAIGTWLSYNLSVGMIPGLMAIGAMTNNPGLIDLAYKLYDPVWQAIIVTVLLICLVTLLTFVRTKRILQINIFIQMIIFLGLAIMGAMCLTTSNAGFASRFNQLSTYYGAPTYGEVISIGKAAGIYSKPADLYGLFMTAAPFLTAPAWVVMISTYMGGEVKEVKKSNLIGTLAAALVSFFFLVFNGIAFERTAGKEFLLGLHYYSLTGAYKLPFVPFFHPFAIMLTDNVVLMWFLFLSVAIIGFWWQVIGIQTVSRCWLAWAFDRIVPSFLGDVSIRTNAPVKAMITTCLIGWIFMLFSIFYPTLFLFYVPVFVFAILCFFVSLAAIIFPLRLGSMYESSPVRYQLGRIPLISVIGIVGICTSAIWIYHFLTMDLLGVNYFGALVGVLGLAISSFIIYFIARFYREKTGISVSLVRKELPPD